MGEGEEWVSGIGTLTENENVRRKIMGHGNTNERGRQAST
jgi:hypothetical protein